MAAQAALFCTTPPLLTMPTLGDVRGHVKPIHFGQLKLIHPGEGI
jgi:hypothetical protein